jgi:hypothetical protein
MKFIKKFNEKKEDIMFTSDDYPEATKEGEEQEPEFSSDSLIDDESNPGFVSSPEEADDKANKIIKKHLKSFESFLK